MLSRYLLLLPLLLILLVGCSAVGTRQNVSHDEQVQKSATEISEEQLLDVWIELFEPGVLPTDKEEASGLSMEIREAEARYMPLQLRDTMEKTGYWGAVRVVPQGTEGGEVTVQGTILVSDAENLELQITALDATGREWFNSTYQAQVSVEAYPSLEQHNQDVFQALYNAIANDLAAHRARLAAEDIVAVRRVAALRFADDLAPDAFSDYLQRDENDRFAVRRLPAHEDPMYRRVTAIRERDFMLIDTLNGHFDNFYHEMQQPYAQWRKTRIEELTAMREIQRQARNRKLMGAAAILGAIAIEAFGGESTRASTGGLRNVMIVGGAYAIKTGFDKDSETTIHREAIEELGDSFSSETRPLVVEVEGETHELTGSAEVQYNKWRSLLKNIYISETGLTGTDD